MAEHLGCQLTEQPRSVVLRKFLEHGKHTLPLRVPYRAEPVTGHGTRHQTRHVGDDEAERPATKPANDAPKLVGRAVRPVLGHALLAHHLLKHIPELCILRALALRPAVALGEEVPRPRVWVGACASVGRVAGWCIVVSLRKGVARRCAAEHVALHIVLAAACRVGQRVVGVVDELELARALGPVWRAVGDTIGVRLQRGSVSSQLVTVVHVETVLGRIYLLYASLIRSRGAFSGISRIASGVSCQSCGVWRTKPRVTLTIVGRWSRHFCQVQTQMSV